MNKVLHVLEHSLPKIAGYTIRSKYIVENQRNEGIEPVVITSPLQGHTKSPLLEYEAIDSMRYYRTGRYNKLNMNASLPLRLFDRYSYSRSYLQAIKTVARRENVSIIHSHSSYLNGVRANAAAKAIGVPSIYEVRGLWQDTATIDAGLSVNHWKYLFINYLEKKAMLKANKVVTLSRQLKKELIQKGVKEDRLFVVPNAVDTNIFSPRRKKNEILQQYGLENKIVIGFIGSIQRIEGLTLIIENVKTIIDRFKNVRVLLVGDGDEVPNLKRLVNDRCLNDYVFFAGHIDHDRILEYYAVVDIFLYPRIDARVNHIVTPLKPLEAMAMGKAVIASDVGGLTELVTEKENGLLFKVNDGDHLVRCCLDLIENPSFMESLGKSARSWVVNERDWKKVIKRYNTIYSV